LSRAEDKLKRQDDVIEEVCTIIAAIGRALFHALRNPLGALPGSNRQFVSSFLSHGWTRMLQRMRSNGQAFKNGLEFQKQGRLAA
jgi:DNA phosphorothioation-dependent restriction protein DptG